MTTPNSLKEKLTSTAEVLIRERLNVLAAVLASIGASPEKQHLLLDQLVTATRNAVIVPAVSDASGVPVPVMVDFDQENNDLPVIKFNGSMLSAVAEVTEGMLIESLANPIAKILGLPVATVAIVLHERDENRIRELSMKLSSSVDGEVINFTSLRSVQENLLQRFFNRIAYISTFLSGGLDVTAISMSDPGVSELLERISTFPRWPNWNAVRGDAETDLTLPFSQPLNQVVQHTCKALSQTPWSQDAMNIIKSVWNCSDLGQRSFLVEVGRSLRAQDVESPASVLKAVAEAVGADTQDLSLRLEDWPRFNELQSAMEQLYLAESSLFGTACEAQTHKKAVSVVDVSGRAFGMDEPAELPWNVPVLCWTQRETEALRDIYLGKCKMTYGTAARDSCRRIYDFNWHDTGDSELTLNRLDKSPNVSLLPVGSLSIPGVADALNVGLQPSSDTSDSGVKLSPQHDSVVERCWKAVFKVLKERFNELPRGDSRTDLVRQMRQFYDTLHLEMQDAWQRRFAPLIQSNPIRAFATLCRTLADVTGKPCLIDPFESMESDTLLERPRLTFICAIEKNSDVCVVWLPLPLLTATTTIGPLTLRLIEEVPQSEDSDGKNMSDGKGSFLWLRDVPFHIDFIKEQSHEQVFECIYGDALQLAISK